MEHQDVLETLKQEDWPDDLISEQEKTDLRIETPLTFGAKNWILHLAFEDQKLTSLKVRTKDSAQLRPHGPAPPDL